MTTLAAQRITALQIFENLSQTTNTGSKMEGLIICKVCLGETPKFNKACHLCHNELGDRCWQCNYLGRPNSKFCFHCNAKLYGLDIPHPDSILPIPPFRPNNKNNNNNSKSYSRVPSTLKLDHLNGTNSSSGMSSPISSTSMPASPKGMVDTEPAIHSIRSIIDSINTKSATTSPPSSTPRDAAKSRFSQAQSKRSIPTSPPSPSTSISPSASIGKSNSHSFTSDSSVKSNNNQQQPLQQKQPITVSIKNENNNINDNSTTNVLNSYAIIDNTKRLSSTSSTSSGDEDVPVNLLDQLDKILKDSEFITTTTTNNQQQQQTQLYISKEFESVELQNTITSITPLTTLSESISNSSSLSSPCLLSSPPAITSAITPSGNRSPPLPQSSSENHLQSLFNNNNNNNNKIINNSADEACTITIVSNNNSVCNSNCNSTCSSANNSIKRRSFNGSSSSLFSEIIDAFPTPPETMILSPTNSSNGKNGASSSSMLSPKTSMSPSIPKSSSSHVSDQRSFLIKEIISTELDYINDLETIIQVFYRPLRDDLKLISTEECASVFSNIEQILEVNKELYSKMVSSSSTIGEVFCLMSDSLDVYSVYCNYHQKSLESLTNLTKLPQIESFISEIISKPELRGMNLHSFLIKPVQRICKYPLLLRELLKATPNDHVDYGQLISAVAKIEQIVNIINKEKMENETWQRTMQIIQSLKGAENLQLSKRHLLSEGNLQMVEGYNENSEKKSTLKFKKGFYFLFNDLFLFTKQKGSVYRLVLSIPLDTVLVHSSISTDKHFFTLVEIGIGGKRWTFFPQSKAQNQVLVISIQKLIEKCWEGRYDPKPTLSPSATNHNGNQPNSPSLQKKKINRLVKSLVNMKTL